MILQLRHRLARRDHVHQHRVGGQMRRRPSSFALRIFFRIWTTKTTHPRPARAPPPADASRRAPPHAARREIVGEGAQADVDHARRPRKQDFAFMGSSIIAAGN
jgi:hypothetical protein